MEKIRIIDINGMEDIIEAEIGVNHIEALVKISEKYGITYDRLSPDAILKKFAQNNYIILLNIGLIDGKITYTVTIPEFLSDEQINYMETQKEFFYQKCDFIGVYKNTDKMTNYNTNIRDLVLENKIYNLKLKNRIDILYNELEQQKRNSKN